MLDQGAADEEARLAIARGTGYCVHSALACSTCGAVLQRLDARLSARRSSCRVRLIIWAVIAAPSSAEASERTD